MYSISLKQLMFQKSKLLIVMTLKSHKKENKLETGILYQKIKKYPSKFTKRLSHECLNRNY